MVVACQTVHPGPSHACLDNYFLAERVGTNPEWATPDMGNPKQRSVGPTPAEPIPMQWLPLPSFCLNSTWVPHPFRFCWQGYMLSMGTTRTTDSDTGEEKGSFSLGVWQGPCYSSGQMGYLCRECPQMESVIGWEVHPSGQLHPAKNLQ